MRDYFRGLKKDFICNFSFIVPFALVLLASYGFTITNFAIGIDDPARIHYLYTDGWGNLVQQGRLTAVVFNFLTGLVDIIPFLNNFLATVILGMAAVAMVGLYQTVSGQKFGSLINFLIASVFVSYSIISMKFIYDLDVITTMASYFCVPVSIFAVYQYFQSKRKRYLLVSGVLLMVAIGTYESFNTVYIAMVLMVLLLELYFQNRKTKQLLKEGMAYAGVLAVTVGVYYTIVKIVQCLFPSATEFTRLGFWKSASSFLSGLHKVCWIIKRAIFESNLFFTKEFVAFLFIGIILAFLLAVKKKRFFILPLFAGLEFVNFVIILIQGNCHYRICQTFVVLISGCALFLFCVVRDWKYIRTGACILAGLLIVWQIRDLNYWFFKDYENYKKNEFALHKIATDLQAGYDISKPVCFTNRDYDLFLTSWDENQKEIGEAVMISSIAMFGETVPHTMVDLFKYHQYNFLQLPTQEQADRAVELSKGMEAYPKPGYIQEFDDLIIVNFKKIE